MSIVISLVKNQKFLIASWIVGVETDFVRLYCSCKLLTVYLTEAVVPDGIYLLPSHWSKTGRKFLHFFFLESTTFSVIYLWLPFGPFISPFLPFIFFSHHPPTTQTYTAIFSLLFFSFFTHFSSSHQLIDYFFYFDQPI